ncbi:hypothetical protein MKW92_017458 [Papaver armeniacum]|nr:hypothetical protein MKW92_017458 [Papaver armeniacum]
MEDAQSVATLIDSTTTKIQQLQQAFAELENHRAVSLNLKWKELEAHFHGLERSLKRRFDDLGDQEKEDAALFVIGDAVKKYKTSSVKPAVVKDEDSCESGLTVEEKPPDMMVSAIDPEEVNKISHNETMDVKPRPELAKLCEEMDSEGLHKYISDNRKNLATIREEIPFALMISATLLRLGLLGLRRTCIMLMECLAQSLADTGRVSSSDVINHDIKEHAKAIAEEWKPKLDDLDAHAFLQLLATFDIARDFDEEEILKLIPTVSRRRQTADLCRLLGLSHKMPGVIEVLVNTGRQIDAVNLAYAFELTEQFSPVVLLKSHLKEARKASSPTKPGNASPTAENEVNDRELTSLKAVVKCIEEHKLEGQYPVDPLQKRIAQLEKAKADKKRVAEAAKPQPKRPRANGGGFAPRVSNINEKSFYATVPDRYPPYNYENMHYVYPGHTNNHPALLMGTAAYNIPPNHGSY